MFHGNGEEVQEGGLHCPKEMTAPPSHSRRRARFSQAKKRELLEQLLVCIRSTPNATARLNRSTITCLLSSSHDKLYAGFDSRKNKLFLTYRVENNRDDFKDHSKLVYDLFQEVSIGIECAEITTGRFYTQILVNPEIAKMNLLVRRLTQKLEDENLENSPVYFPKNVEHLPSRFDHEAFDEIAELACFAARQNLQLPFGSSFRQLLGFDSIDHLITIGHSDKALRSKRSEHYREHVVPVVLIKNEIERMAKAHAPSSVISKFLKSHLAILIITKEEAKVLDSQIANGKGDKFRVAMPEGWKWGEDSLARLKAVGITPRFINGYQPSRWPGWSPSVINSAWYWLNKPLFKF